MTSGRSNHTATLLPNGKVLLAGGSTGGAIINTGELFDPATGTFTPLPNNMNSARYLHTAALLSLGKVLLIGGSTATGDSAATNAAEVFDPATQTFTAVNTMNSSRSQHSATLLLNSTVLVTSGSTNNGSVTDGAMGGITNSAEVADEGLAFSDTRRPVLTTVQDPFVSPARIVLTGSGFRGDSDAAGDSFQSSAGNYPIVRLTRIDNEQTIPMLSNSATNWTDTTFSSETLGLAKSLLAGPYRVTVFVNAIPSVQKIINVTTGPVEVDLVSTVSRKSHGDAGMFDVDLPLTGTTAIECRSGGTNGDYQLVFTFANTLTNVGGVRLTNGAGTVNNTSGIGTDAHQYIVDLTGVTNAQTITISLTNVTDSVGNSSSTVSASMRVLIGDTNGDGTVNSGDISQTKSQSGIAVTGSNFREDVTADGFVNSADIALVKSKSGTVL